ncbi:phosphomannomutase [Methylophaga sp. OBS4]|uniref:phosphomannomutase n=1 Tax=Methylophaga sp. OBS4 TaxID=2991935 RepID=UPI002255670F|nr:phosphomannomutase [Methylophaga sp. OBS4]MCX4188509.1 phosphomannomutase [Methylophaga sp. OBS4]
MKIKIDELMARSGVKFGTSGTRGLVVDMTDKVCFAYVVAFLQQQITQGRIAVGDRVGIAGDLRSSTDRIMNAVAAACVHCGFLPLNYGYIPSPALALFGLNANMATIMVTGSHIPDDRNGIKFNSPLGEILHADEVGIRSQLVELPAALFNSDDSLKEGGFLPAISREAHDYYLRRYLDFLPEKCLQGKTIGLYEHSAVTRECLKTLLHELGASVVSLGRSDKFISVDTEAIRPEDIALAREWSQAHSFDAIVSTDGDGDRPLISDEHGEWLRGDIAGILCAQFLGADTVITPVSSNSAVEQNLFARVIRTKIGSPYVIEAMQLAAETEGQKVVGYEANGGFLQQSPLEKYNRILAPLPTRDAVIVILSVMLLAQHEQKNISELVATLPQRFTASDRIKNFLNSHSKNLLEHLVSQGKLNHIAVTNLLPDFTEPVALDLTDGVRIVFDNNEVVHFRPSGNAPELRCYTEADSQRRAEDINRQALAAVFRWQEQQVQG